jgi:cytochrome b561
MAERYTRTAIALHWLVALGVLAQIGFGWALGDVPRGTPERTIYVNLHKSTGLVLGALILLRLGWRLTHPAPPLPDAVPPWQRRAARASHALLYVCMLVMPLAGYAASNFSRFGVNFFNAVLLPPWGPDERAAYAFFNGVHVWTSYLFVLLIALHVAAALKHLVARDGVFARITSNRAS